MLLNSETFSAPRYQGILALGLMLTEAEKLPSPNEKKRHGDPSVLGSA